MTEDVTGTELPEAPPGHYYAELKGRSILVKEINDAQSMMLGTIYRNLKNVAEYGAALDALGRIGTLFEALIVTAEDRYFLEEAILRGELEIADFASVFVTLKKKEAAAPAAPKRPRRGRQ